MTSAHPELVSRPLPQARRGAYPAWMFRFASCHLSGSGAHGESLSGAARLVRRTCEPAEAGPEEERMVLERIAFVHGCTGGPAAAEGPLDRKAPRTAQLRKISSGQTGSSATARCGPQEKGATPARAGSPQVLNRAASYSPTPLPTQYHRG